MKTVAEIQIAIEQLAPDELLKLSHWFDSRIEQIWDVQMESDAKAGRFNRFATEIAKSRVNGELIDFP